MIGSDLVCLRALKQHLAGKSLKEIAEKEGVTVNTISRRIKKAQDSDYVKRARERLLSSLYDGVEVYEKVLRMKNWKKLDRVEKNLQVKVASDVLRGLGVLRENVDTRFQGDITIEITSPRPPVQAQQAEVISTETVEEKA